GDRPDLADELRRRLLDLEAATEEFRTALTGLGPAVSAEAGPAGAPELRPGDEPLPGFRLEKRLGRGGFGEVWQATAPGGFAVALKFGPLSRPAGAAEQQALAIVRQVRHVHLLTLFGAWQTDSLLIIAMELADRSLLQRLDEAVGRGLAGLPRVELLRHAQAAAA